MFFKMSRRLAWSTVSLAFSFFLCSCNDSRSSSAPVVSQSPAAPVKLVKGGEVPLRAYITLQNLTLGKSNQTSQADSQVSLSYVLPEGKTGEMPKAGDVWQLGEGASLSLFQTFEVPNTTIKDDKFTFTVQMHRKGQSYDACHFEVEKLSEFNRTYLCRTVESEDGRTANLAVQVSVFSNRNLSPNQMARRLVQR